MLEPHPPKIKALLVTNVCKRYSEKGELVLNQLNLSLDSGSIYGLLGSSGCGKTTLLECIVGLRKPDSGQISLLSPLVGYMPQDVALYDSFTILETFSYFGNLYGIPNKIMTAQLETLSDILKIPEISCHIKTLSGGEKRRVSLAVSLLHNPKFLILDEPTVGVDPLLRERIWEYLVRLVKFRGMTVLLTTHYTEEVRNCDMVGFLRRGRLLVEDEPNSLLNKFNTNLLQTVILHLCRQDDGAYQDSDKIASPNLDTVKVLSYKSRDQSEVVINQNSETPAPHSVFSDWKKMKGLIQRNWINIFRHIQLVIMLVTIPFVHIALGVFVVGKNPSGLNLGIVGNPPCLESCANSSFYSSRFMRQLEASTWHLETFPSESEALRSVTLGQTTGYLVLPQNFSEHFQNRLLFRLTADQETLDGSTIRARLDMSEFIRVIFMLRSLLESLGSFTVELLQDYGVDPRFAELPLRFHAIYGSFDGSWRDYFLPNFIVFAIFILQTAYGLFHIQDRKTGTLSRTLCSGASHTQILGSYFITTFPILLTQILVMLLVTGFSVQIPGSWILIGVQSLLVGLSGTAYGLLVGVLFDHEMQAVFGILFMFLTSQAMGGLTWPLDDVDWRLRALCYCLPLTAPLSGMRSVMTRGWGVSHPQILLGLGTSLIYILGCLGVTRVLIRFRK